MMKAKPRGLYVHIPFCLKKCNYCDFCSFSNLSSDERKLYIIALTKEILSYKKEEKTAIDTIFFGGGTPSLLSPEDFHMICNSIYDSFDVSSECEFTIEANPKTLTKEKVEKFVECGVNRISVGLQTIHENERKILGRIHNFSDFEDAITLVKNAGITNINVDVMYGIPEQTVGSFTETIKTVISFKPTHISAYGLILEEETPLYQMQKKLTFPSEALECEMYYSAVEILSDSGYLHYEISNYALEGFESKHNLKYWKNEEYIGVGLSAYSFFENKRYGNTNDMSVYLSCDKKKYIYEETITKEISAYEYVMLGLRLSQGISIETYKELYGIDFLTEREEKINMYINQGYMVLKNKRLSLTDRGFYVSNAILTELI